MKKVSQVEKIGLENIVYRSAKGTPITDSLKIARIFGREHRSLLRTIRDTMRCAQNCAHTWFYETTYLDMQGKKRPLFVMNRDGFSLLAMGFTGEEAMRFKIRFIERFDSMEQMALRPEAALPATFAEALRLAADQAEKIERQKALLAQQAPQVLFAQSVAASGRSILIGDMAKLLMQNGVNIGEKRFFQWLRANHYLCEFGSRYNLPTQRAMELHLFEIKETTITCPNGETLLSHTTKITGRGQIYFMNKFISPVNKLLPANNTTQNALNCLAKNQPNSPL